MTTEQLASIAGVLLSLCFTYIPGIKDWYEPQPTTVKQIVMGLALLVVAIGAFALSCANLVAVIACNQDGALGLIGTLIAALVANQATYLITRKKSPA